MDADWDEVCFLTLDVPWAFCTFNLIKQSSPNTSSLSEPTVYAYAYTLLSQVTRIPFPPPGVHAMSTPVTTMTFDTTQELLWTGNDYVWEDPKPGGRGWTLANGNLRVELHPSTAPNFSDIHHSRRIPPPRVRFARYSSMRKVL
jgi:hypothetical protein